MHLERVLCKWRTLATPLGVDVAFLRLLLVLLLLLSLASLFFSLVSFALACRFLTRFTLRF